MKTRRRRITKSETPLLELRSRLNLTIPEAMRLTGFGRQSVNGLIESGEWQTFQEGQRLRVITRSIVEWQDRRAEIRGI